MGWKEREAEIREAATLIRKQQVRYGKKGTRIHAGGMVDRVARLRALEDKETCGECRGLKIRYETEGSLVNVVLRCRFGGSPLDLHRLEKTPLGEVPKCEFRIPFEE